MASIYGLLLMKETNILALFSTPRSPLLRRRNEWEDTMGLERRRGSTNEILIEKLKNK
jgi:hypothetical protein